MMFKDDDEELPAPGSADYLNRADHGKQEARERKAAGKGLLLSLKRTLLRQQVNPGGAAKAMNKEEKSDAEDAAKKRETNDEKTNPIATKTLTERAEEQMQTAQKTLGQDEMIQESKHKEDVKKQSGQEYQQNMS